MKLSTWAEVVGIAALILSIVFVGIEIRDNTAATRLQALLELNVAANEMSLAIIGSGEMAAIHLKGHGNLEDLSDVDRNRYRSWVYGILNIHENAFMFSSGGILDEASYAAWAASLCDLLSEPGVQVIWRNEGQAFNEDFNDFIVSQCRLTR